MNDNNLNTMNRRDVLQYTVIFAIISVGAFSVFIISGKSFIQHSDGFRQGYFWIVQFKHAMESFMAGNGLPLWSWSKGFGMDITYRLDPFNMLAALFPLKYIELGITVAITLKLYLGGLMFLLLCRYLNMTSYQGLAGSTCYVFSGWFMSMIMTQSSFIFMSYLFPLVIWSVERIYRGKSPLPFIFAVAYFLVRDTYLAYMAAIITLMYFVLRYFAYREKPAVGDFLRQIGRFILYGIIAGLIAALAVIPFALSVLNANTDSTGGGIDLFYPISYLYKYGTTLTGTGLTSSYSIIGLPILLLLVLPVALSKTRLRNTNALMTAILMAFMFFPFFSSMFNGFGYTSGRWYVFVLFFACLTCAEALDLEKLAQKRNFAVLCVWYGVLVLWTLGVYASGLSYLPLRSLAFVLILLAGGAGIILIIGLFPRSRITIRQRQLATIAVTGFILVFCWSMNYYLNLDKFFKVSEIYGLLEKSTQRVSAVIDEDDFYRTDQVDWINAEKTMKMPANENLFWQSHSIYAYDSFVSSDQLRLNKLTGNNYGYQMRVYTMSNDNRMGLDFISGVRYYLGDDTENGRTGSDEYAGYGFSEYKEIDGVRVFRSKYDAGLGFVYDACMAESEFMKLDRFEREQALLQAAVIPDDALNSGGGDSDSTGTDAVLSGIKQLSAGDIDTDVKNLEYEIISSDGITMTDTGLTADHSNASVTLKVNDTAGSQVIVSFDNLSRGGGGFPVSATNGRITEYAEKVMSNQSLPDVDNFDLNMGYCDSDTEEITIRFPYGGDYTFDSFRIAAMSTENFDRYASQCENHRFKVSDYGNHYVRGSVNAGEDGILFLSVPYTTSWKVYIDGKEADTIKNTDIAYTGVSITKGNHEILMKYRPDFLIPGIIMTVIGLILAAAIEVIRRRASS